MKIKVIAKIIIALIPISVGTYLSVKDYLAMIKHPEWSASSGVVWIKFGIGLVISLILLVALFKHKN